MHLRRVRRSLAAGIVAGSIVLCGGAGLAQAPQPSTPPAAQAPAPEPGAPPPAAPTAPAPAAPTVTGPRGTLVETPGDPSDVDEVTLVAKPVAILSGQSSWDDAFKNLKGAFKRLNEELAKAGIAPTGRPLTRFVQSDDDGFRYEAMIPIERTPEGRPAISADVRFGMTPAGRALRFVHKGPYDDIEATYETMTAYVDAKDLTVQDTLIEEYLTDLGDASDANLEINIFALLQ